MRVNEIAHESTPSLQNSAPPERHRPRPSLRNISDPRIKLSLVILRKDHVSPPRVEEFAAKYNVTSSHFRHLFKKHVGVSPTHYLRLLRIRAAKKLLRTTYLSVKEIMAAVGENDLSHFVRHYKDEYGETPSETRALAMRRGVPGYKPTRNIGQ
jgi:transcriptional regulator GlxA family with amidase domain